MKALVATTARLNDDLGGPIGFINVGLPDQPCLAVLLFDEPSNGLDVDARAVLIALLADRGEATVTLISTHDQAFAEAVGATVIAFEMLGTVGD